jgi:hypothetical protein
VERAIRGLEAVAASIVATADRREVFREDGHASVRGWVTASVRIADVEWPIGAHGQAGDVVARVR